LCCDNLLFRRTTHVIATCRAVVLRLRVVQLHAKKFVHSTNLKFCRQVLFAFIGYVQLAAASGLKLCTCLGWADWKLVDLSLQLFMYF
jgi:hypothetical protein